MWFTDIAEVQEPGKNELVKFVDGVMTFLRFVLEDQQDYFAFLWEHGPQLHQMARDTFDSDVTASSAELSNAIPQIDNAILTRHGLLYEPLRFKLSVLNTIADRWDQVRNQLSIRGWFKRLVEAIDAVLDSLIEAAGGVGGLIKEFKDALSALAGSET